MRRALLVLLTLLPLAAGLAAPPAAAFHICQPNEPPWQCEHREPTPGEVVDYLCRQSPVITCRGVLHLA